MPIYNPDLTTLDYVRAKRGIGEAKTNDDDMLKDYIHEASAWFQERCQRVFVPYVDTLTFDAYGSHISPRRLRLDQHDLLEVVSITNGDSTAVTSSQYILREPNFDPKYEIELLPSGGVNWTYEDDYQNAISVRGTLGFHQNFAAAFTPLTTLTGTLTPTGTLAAVASTSGVQVLGYYRVGKELVQAQSIHTSGSPGTLVIERAVNGTSATTYNPGTSVEAYRQNARIQSAVTRLASWFYDHRDAKDGGFGARIQYADGAALITGEIPPDIESAARDFARKDILG